MKSTPIKNQRMICNHRSKIKYLKCAQSKFISNFYIIIISTVTLHLCAHQQTIHNNNNEQQSCKHTKATSMAKQLPLACVFFALCVLLSFNLLPTTAAPAGSIIRVEFGSSISKVVQARITKLLAPYLTQGPSGFGPPHFE